MVERGRHKHTQYTMAHLTPHILSVVSSIRKKKTVKRKTAATNPFVLHLESKHCVLHTFCAASKSKHNHTYSTIIRTHPFQLMFPKFQITQMQRTPNIFIGIVKIPLFRGQSFLQTPHCFFD